MASELVVFHNNFTDNLDHRKTVRYDYRLIEFTQYYLK